MVATALCDVVVSPVCTALSTLFKSAMNVDLPLELDEVAEVAEAGVDEELDESGELELLLDVSEPESSF